MRIARMVLLLTTFLWPVAALGQTSTGTASVEGAVTDPSGAALVNARISVAGADGTTRVAHTDPLGRYSIGLAPGRYTVTIEAPGLSPVTETISIVTQERRRFDAALAVASISDVVIVAAQRLGSVSPLEPRLPGSFETVPTSLLEQIHAPSVTEALRHVAGLAVRDEEGNGLRPNIGIRGLNPTRSSKLLLLEDGVPVTFAPYGDNASYYHPPLERFESIEVLKGAGQIAYGPSTVGGVVNYLTPTPPQRLSGILTGTAGNRAQAGGTATVGGSLGGFGLLLDAMARQSDGARDHIHSDLADVSGKMMWASSGRHVLIGKASYYRERSQITYSGLRAAEYAENPRQNPFINDAFAGDRFGGSLAHNAVLRTGALLTTTAYAARFSRDWWRQSSNSGQRPNDASDPACAGMANLLTTCGNEGRLRRYTTAGAETRATVDHRFGTFTAGVRAHIERQDRRQENGATPTARTGTLAENNERNTNAFSGFAQQRIVLGALAVTPGVRLEHVRNERTNHLANAGAGATGAANVTQVIPGIGAAWSAKESVLVFAGVHRGFAPPRVEDIVTNAGGVVDLDAELSWNSEFGLRTRPVRGVSFDATLFRMDYENQIVAASLAGGAGATLTNGGQTLSQGLEVAAALDAHAPWSRGFFGRVAYTYLPIARFEGTRLSAIPGFAATNVSGNRLPYAPEQLLTATAGYAPTQRWDVFVEAVRTGSQFTDDLNTVPVSTDGQRGLIDPALTWNAGLNLRPHASVQVFVTAYNLADKTYVADRSRGTIPAPPRRVQAGARFRF